MSLIYSQSISSMMPSYEEQSSVITLDSGLLDLNSFLIDQNWSLYTNNTTTNTISEKNNDLAAGDCVDVEQTAIFDLNSSNNNSKLHFLNDDFNFEMLENAELPTSDEDLDFNLLNDDVLESLNILLENNQEIESFKTELDSATSVNSPQSISPLDTSSSYIFSPSHSELSPIGVSEFDDDSQQSYSCTASNSATSLKRINNKKRGIGQVNKKESNRTAAIRYRNKKVIERDTLFSECEFFAKKNADMKKKIDDTLTEISFIKFC